MMYVYIGYYYKTAAVKFVTLQKTNAGWACFMQQELFSPGGVAFCHNNYEQTQAYEVFSGMRSDALV